MSELNPQRVVAVFEERLKLAEFERNVWVVNAEEGTTVNDVLAPAYWAHVAPKLRTYDRIEVRVDTGEWLMELIVLNCERNWARVHVLEKYELSEATVPAETTTHKVAWKGPQKKFCVIRISDQLPVQEGLADKGQAFAWLRQHEATMT